ncbi:MAG: fumarylacetoacetate hydrolase family protein [Planctomycetes bacterium]|nr:fumarylacetoacetate hydrolase family protein [Planctomycetota bacterium]
MKLVLHGNYRLGVLRDGQVIDVTSALGRMYRGRPGEVMRRVVEEWGKLRPRIEGALQSGQGSPVESVRLRPPVPRPGQLVCLAGNYLEPARPDRGAFNAFLKPPTSIIGPKETVELPPASVKYFHFEPELAVVIGKKASRVPASEAMQHVFGYTPFLDASARGLPGGFFLGKSWHTFGPMGPALVTADEVTDPHKLGVRLWVNDELRHDFSTASMGRLIPEVIAEVTQVMALEPGDVVSTGTHHQGLRPIQDGDRLRLEIEGLGPALHVSVRDPLKRTSWAAD